MSIHASRSWGRAVSVAITIIALLIPAVSEAQCAVALSQPPTSSTGSVLGVLNETRERIRFRLDPSPLSQGQIIDGFRIARAVEQGELSQGCGSLAGFEGRVEALATSKIPVNIAPDGTVNLGIGPISGSFTVAATGGRVTGQLNGILDFVPTNSTVTLCGGPCPFVWAAGSWTARQARENKTGSFAGVALIPFQDPTTGAWVYLDPTGVLTGQAYAVVPLQPDDFNASGEPEAKFILNLFD